MKHWFQVTKRWSLAIASAATLTIGAMALLSCGGEGGPINGGGGGGGTNSYTAQFMALLPAGQAGATYVGSDACKTCHNGTYPLSHPEPYFDDWSGTMHASKNVTCEQCHGPGSKHVAQGTSADATTILAAPKVTSPIVCAQCHGPTFDQWNSSGHAQIIADAVNSGISNPAGQNSGRCMQCHSGLIRTMSEEKGVDLGTMTNQQIIDLGNQSLTDAPYTASCDTCHDPHKQTGNLTWEGEERQLRHPELNTDTTNIGAGATGVQYANFDQICAQCHNGRGTNPSDANLVSSTSRAPMHHSNQYNMLMGEGGVEGNGVVQRNMAHATAPGQCAHCHMPNSSHTYTTSYDVSCQPCHTGAGAAALAQNAQTTMINSLYALRTRLQTWSTSAFNDPDLWDYTSNITALGKTPPNQSLVPIEIKRARYNYWYIVIDNSYGPHNFPYATTLITVANQNLDSLGVPGPAKPMGQQADLTTAQKLKILRGDLALSKKADQETGN